MTLLTPSYLKTINCVLINIGFYVFCHPMGAQFKGIMYTQTCREHALNLNRQENYDLRSVCFSISV